MNEKTYKILRFYKDMSHPDNRKIIKKGLTLEKAKEHCEDPSTCDKDGAWFNGYEEEDQCMDKVKSNIFLGVYCPNENCDIKKIFFNLLQIDSYPLKTNCRCGAEFDVEEPQNLKAIVEKLQEYHTAEKQ